MYIDTVCAHVCELIICCKVMYHLFYEVPKSDFYLLPGDIHTYFKKEVHTPNSAMHLIWSLSSCTKLLDALLKMF